MALSGVNQLYAFLGVFLFSGLILFLPTRGDFDRPDELEAEAYEPRSDPASRVIPKGPDAPGAG
jgi:hypothetical protein